MDNGRKEKIKCAAVKKGEGRERARVRFWVRLGGVNEAGKRGREEG